MADDWRNDDEAVRLIEAIRGESEAALVEKMKDALNGKPVIDRIAAVVAESRDCDCGGVRNCGCWNVALRISREALAGVAKQ